MFFESSLLYILKKMIKWTTHRGTQLKMIKKLNIAVVFPYCKYFWFGSFEILEFLMYSYYIDMTDIFWLCILSNIVLLESLQCLE